ncbi:hypothetical protein NQ314_011528, partial [Rhamnusium bicolor]
WVNSIESMIIVNGTLSVDSFLVVGGALVVYVFIKSKRQGIKFNIFQYYIHRYIRLTPALAAVVLVSATLLDYMGSGPKWTYIKSDFSENCKLYWWSSLLYCQNYVNVNKMCVGHTWYLDIDMQLYLVSPIILLLLWKYHKVGLTLLIISVIIFITVPFYIAFRDELAGIITNFYPRTPKDKFMNNYYLRTHTRAAPWLIGVLLGYAISEVKYKNLSCPKINKGLVILAWIICLAVILTCLFGGHSTLRSPDYDRLGNAFYIALIRPVWALCVAWIIWACVMGYGGNPFEEFGEDLIAIDTRTIIDNSGVACLKEIEQTGVQIESRKLNMDEFFRYENQEFPPSISLNGGLRSGNKSNLVEILEKIVLVETTNPKHCDGIVCDGAAMTHLVVPRVAKTFQEYFRLEFYPYIKSKTSSLNCKRVDVVWDLYNTDTIKKAQRQVLAKGPINTFLSLSIYQVLNRFTYSIYLLHVTMLYMIVFAAKTSIYFSTFNMVYLFWGIYMISFGLSIVWVLAFESPMIVIEKIIFNSRK